MVHNRPTSAELLTGRKGHNKLTSIVATGEGEGEGERERGRGREGEREKARGKEKHIKKDGVEALYNFLLPPLPSPPTGPKTMHDIHRKIIFFPNGRCFPHTCIFVWLSAYMLKL